MKNIAILACMLVFLRQGQAQPIPNNGFENWSIKNLFNEPSGFSSSNLPAYSLTGIGNVKKVADAAQGIFAVKLETVAGLYDSVQGLIILGTPGDKTINGGIPYTEMPDSVTGFIKKNIKPGDTANFILLFKKQGEVTGKAQARFTGASAVYEQFSVPVTFFGGAPDTLAAIMSSSNMDPPFYPGSSIIIDNINFIGSSKPFPNNSFESWSAKNTEEPNQWATYNFYGLVNGVLSATKSIDAYDNNYSLRLESVLSPWNEIICGLSNSRFINAPGGMPVNNNPQKISGYYKYVPQGPDTAFALLKTYYFNSASGTATALDSSAIPLPPANDFTYFELPLSYKGSPIADTMNITFYSCNRNDNSYQGLGSVLMVDKLEVDYYSVTGISSVSKKTIVTVSPNPAKNTVQFNAVKDVALIELFDILGNCLTRFNPAEENRTEIDVASFPAGIYLYKIISKSNECTIGKIAIEK